jgi:general L-amino acid transport system permease protein
MAEEFRAASPQPLRHHTRRVSNVAIQLVTLGLILGLAGGAVYEAAQNLAREHLASGFGFWNNTAGFDISQTLIAYSPSTSTFGRAFWVGFLNTLLVAAIGIVLATVLGFAVGIARLSHNWLVTKLAAGYVELTRNVPLLLQLLFWYNAVLKSLPDLRESVTLPGGTILNNRGLFLARPEFAPRFSIVLIVLALGIAATLALKSYANRRHDRTGDETPVLWPAVGLIVVLPLGAFALAGFPLSFSLPHLGRFNVSGGVEILPEFAALVLALSLYTAGFIAEVVRAGMLSVSHGQVEAAQALGLRSGLTLRLIVLPQAMRVIIPPLTSQYLNLIKNSSLAVAIGYPDLVQVFAGTVLTTAGHAVEVIAVTMAVYLFISLSVSLLMNLYGRTTVIAER